MVRVFAGFHCLFFSLCYVLALGCGVLRPFNNLDEIFYNSFVVNVIYVSVNTVRSKAVLLLCGSFCFLCLVFVMLSRLFITALWSLAGKELTSWLLFVMSNCDFVTSPCGILGQVW